MDEDDPMRELEEDRLVFFVFDRKSDEYVLWEAFGPPWHTMNHEVLEMGYDLKVQHGYAWEEP